MGREPHQICHLGIGYVPEDRRIFPKLTVRQNLQVGLKPKQKVENPWTMERIYEFFPILQSAVTRWAAIFVRGGAADADHRSNPHGKS